MEQYLLSPVQLGIPNTRLRYYCLASRHGTDGDGNISIIRELPPDSLASCSSVEALERTPQQGGLGLRPLSEFLVSLNRFTVTQLSTLYDGLVYDTVRW